jgi:hypothetical protein
MSYKIEDITGTVTTTFGNIAYTPSAAKTGDLVISATPGVSHYVYKNAAGNYLGWAPAASGASPIYGYNSGTDSSFAFTQAVGPNGSGTYFKPIVNRLLNLTIAKKYVVTGDYIATYGILSPFEAHAGSYSNNLGTAVTSAQTKTTTDLSSSYVTFSAVTLTGTGTQNNAATIYTQAIAASDLVTGTFSSDTTVTYTSSLEDKTVTMDGGTTVSASVAFTVANADNPSTKVPGGSFTLSTGSFESYDVGMQPANMTIQYTLGAESPSGVVTFTGVPEGTYYLQQAAARLGYQVNEDLDASKTYTVTIPIINIDINYAPCWQVVVGSDGTVTLAKYDPIPNLFSDRHGFDVPAALT